MNHRLVFVLGCLFLSSSYSLECNVSRGDDHTTTYNISGLPRVPDADWSYSYGNASDHVIADDVQGLPGLVLKNNKTSLTIAGCIKNIIYTGTVVSTLYQYVVNCSVSCNESARHQNPQEISRNLIIACAFAGVGLLLLCGLLFIFRGSIPWCRQLGCRYTGVKTADMDVAGQV